MDIGGRIRKLRKNLLDLTQADFGEKIGLKQAVVGQMENGTRNVTERTILMICEKYGVSENWLRYGEGEPLRLDEDAAISAVAAKYHLNEIDIAVMKLFLELPPQKRETLIAFAASIAEVAQSASSDSYSKIKPSLHIVPEPDEKADEDAAEFRTAAQKAASDFFNDIIEKGKYQTPVNENGEFNNSG